MLDDELDIRKRLDNYISPSTAPINMNAYTPSGSVQGQEHVFGSVNVNERDSALRGWKRYRTFINMALNSHIVSTGVSLYLDLATRSRWEFVPAQNGEGMDRDGEGKYAEMSKQILMEDPMTTFRNIVARSSMFRFNGYSVQNWWVKRDKEAGMITIDDIENRPPETIEDINVDIRGNVTDFEQRTLTNQLVRIPKSLSLYLADNSIETKPEGSGLYRSLYPHWIKLQRYNQLLGYGFETDLRGVPIGLFPMQERYVAIKRDHPGWTTEQINQAVMQEMQPLLDFIKNHIKTPERGTVLESAVYSALDEAARPIPARKHDIRVLENEGTSFGNVENSIIRLEREMALIMGIEQSTLGSDSTGSWALAKVQSDQFGLRVTSSLNGLSDAFRDQLLKPVFILNGWDTNLVPDIKVELPTYTPPVEQAAILQQLNMLAVHPEDTVIDEIRAAIGLSRMPEGAIQFMMDRADEQAQTDRDAKMQSKGSSEK